MSTNFPSSNQRALRQLRDFASTDWKHIDHAHEAGKQALKMEAALKLVLLFHSASPWTSGKQQEWHNLLCDAGKSGMGERDATTRTLCNTIREVLGMQQEIQYEATRRD